MDKDRVKGTVDDAMGRVKRQAGEWTGDINKQLEGAGQQMKGKAEKAWGNVKDAARQTSHDVSHDAGHPTGPQTAHDDRAHRKSGSVSSPGADRATHKTH